MIANSYVWKKELKKELHTFSKFSAITDFSDEIDEVIDMDRIFLKIEKFFFISSFIIRKLHESHKLSDELIGVNIALEKFPRKEENMDEYYDLINRFDIEEFFDLENPIKCSLGAMKLCNNIIHSFFFFPFYDLDIQPGKTLLGGVLFTSDKGSRSAIYSISLSSFFSFIEQVIDDEVTSIQISRKSGKVKKSKYSIDF